MCPHCGKNAPIVYRGLMGYCTACGKPRAPLTGSALNLAGQPSKIGGAVATGLGWTVLAVGLVVALLIGAVAQAVFPAGIVGYAVGVPLAILSVVLGLLLLRGGKRLTGTGSEAEKSARTAAVFALAAHRGGALTPLDVAQALGIPLPEADALLTSLAKEQMDHVGVEIDPAGGIYYRFTSGGAMPQAPDARVRVDPEIARSPNRAEWERLEAEAADADAARPDAERRARAARPPR